MRNSSDFVTRGKSPLSTRILLLDFVAKTTRWITQEEMAERMAAQHMRGVRMSHEGVPLPPEDES